MSIIVEFLLYILQTPDLTCRDNTLLNARQTFLAFYLKRKYLSTSWGTEAIRKVKARCSYSVSLVLGTKFLEHRICSRIHNALVVKTFFEKGEAPSELDVRLLQLNLEIFRCSDSAVDSAQSEPSKTARTHENVKSLRQSFLQLPQNFARKHATTHGLSASNVRWQYRNCIHII